MSDRQIFLDKDVEPFMIKEAMTSLKRAEEYLNGYLQVDKARGK